MWPPDSTGTLVGINSGVCELKTRFDFGLTLIICVGVWIVSVVGIEMDVSWLHITKSLGIGRVCVIRCMAVYDWRYSYHSRNIQWSSCGDFALVVCDLVHDEIYIPAAAWSTVRRFVPSREKIWSKITSCLFVGKVENAMILRLSILMKRETATWCLLCKWKGIVS